MSYEVKTKLASPQNYTSGSKRVLSSILYAVVHYTGNDGDSDEANTTYFSRPGTNASAHYFIDDDSVTMSVPDEYVAWSVGGGLKDQGYVNKAKGAKYYNVCTNNNSISFELCDTQKNGKNDISSATRANAVDFIARKMVELNIDIDHLIRHFDVNGKLCPLYYVTDENEWNNFKKDISSKIIEIKGSKVVKESTSTTTTNNSTSTAAKSIDVIAQEVINGKWGNGTDRTNKLKAAGYDPVTIQNKVNELLNTKTTNKTSTVVTKSIDVIAQEVINGKWGNGTDRTNKLKAAGYDPTAVQNKVNRLLNTKTTNKTSTVVTKSIDVIAQEVINGKWGNGTDRVNKLKAAGYDPTAVQNKVNRLLNTKTASATKSITAVAQEVINGKWGNGTDRTNKLKAAGYDPTEVQKEVNRLLK